jgi:hypothetical protein
VNALIALPAGRILAGGTSVASGTSNVASTLALYSARGSLVPGFGRRGIVVTRWPGLQSGTFGLALDPRGRLVTGGFQQTTVDFSRPAVARYLLGGAFTGAT